MLDPQTSLDSTFFPISSFMAKKAWIHKYPLLLHHLHHLPPTTSSPLPKDSSAGSERS